MAFPDVAFSPFSNGEERELPVQSYCKNCFALAKDASENARPPNVKRARAAIPVGKKRGARSLFNAFSAHSENRDLRSEMNEEWRTAEIRPYWL